MLNLCLKFLSFEVFLPDFYSKLEDFFVSCLHVSVNLIHCFLKEVHFISYCLSLLMLPLIIVIHAQHLSLEDLFLPFDFVGFRLLPGLLLSIDLFVHLHLFFNRFAVLVLRDYLVLELGDVISVLLNTLDGTGHEVTDVEFAVADLTYLTF